jgi:hypothetical protein
MTLTKTALIPALAIAVMASSALAEHEDILVALDSNGQLVTGTAELDSGTYAIGKRAFGFHPPGPLGGLYATTDPGYNAVQQSELPAGYTALPGDAELKFDIAADTIGGVTANFWYWDGVDDNGNNNYYDDVDWTPVPPGYTYEFDLLDALEAIADGSGSAVPGFPIWSTDSVGYLHKHLNMYMDDGDGNAATSVQDGFYLVGIDLYVDEPSVLRSETLYFLPSVGHHTPAQHRDGAVAWVNNNLVPEPASLSLLAIGALACLRRRKV